MLQTVIVRIEQQYLHDDLIQKLYGTLTNLCSYDVCRQGVLFILNGLLNTAKQEQCNNLAGTVLEIINSTIQNKSVNGDNFPFDSSCKRLATGLIQDLATSINQHIVGHLEMITNLIFRILDDGDISLDVKITAIVAIGDICLVTEIAFEPYLEQTMNALIQAGRVSLSSVDKNMPIEDQQNIHDLRQSLIDAFLSIINGIKSPPSQSVQVSQVQSQLTHSSIHNMFFYLEGLMQLADLSVNHEFARQILDLYSDIVMLQQTEVSREAQAFINQVRNSNVH